MNNRHIRVPITLVGAACLCLSSLSGNTQDSMTVIGPTNPDLSLGATELLAGNGEEGVRLTLLGLQVATTRRDRLTGMSNLCAGYIMLEEMDEALSYCDRVIAENDRHWRAYNNRALAYVMLDRLEEAEQDLQKAEVIAPKAHTIKVVRSMLRDKTDPVAPSIVIDDRRNVEDDEN
jgi:tetratricopeptide (TPR) repeat protein